MRVSAEVREATVRVQVRRADGRVEDLGVVSHYEREPAGWARIAVRRWWARVAEGRRALLARFGVGGARIGAAKAGWVMKPRLVAPWWGRSGAGKER